MRCDGKCDGCARSSKLNPGPPVRECPWDEDGKPHFEPDINKAEDEEAQEEIGSTLSPS